MLSSATMPPRRPAIPRRPAWTLVLVGLALLPALASACRRETPAPRPLPTAVVAEAGPGLAGRTPDAAPAAVPLPTWTRPSGIVELPGGAAAPGLPTSPLDAIPPEQFGRPTARPTEVLDAAGPGLDPAILSLLGQVDGARMLADVEYLAAFSNRHAAGANAAEIRAWLLDAFERAGAGGPAQLLTETEPFELRLGGQRSEQANVIATLSGIGFSKRMIYLVAHQDSRAEDPKDAAAVAPGADDDASGLAMLLELARVMSRRQWDGTLRFLATAAEEQGLEGARRHATAAESAGLPILAVIGADIVGGSLDGAGQTHRGQLQAFSAGPEESESRQLARYAAFVAERYRAATGLELLLVPAPDREGREGDHLAFSAVGFPALRLIEAAEDPSRQHNARDTIDRIDRDYLANVTRLGLALAASLALAPPAPDSAPTLEATDGGLGVSWAPVADPAVAGYWLAWRAEGESAWREVVWVGAGATRHVFAELAADARVRVAVASSSDLGHASRFGPEASR